MSSLLKLFFIAVAAFSLVACSEKDVNPNRDLTLDDFSTMRVSDYVVSLSRLKQHLDSQVRDDRDTVASDYFLRNYYQQGGRLLWVDRQGVDRRADTLLAYLRHVDKIGFSPNRFRVPQIEADLQRMRHLQFDTLHTASRVVARLEYNLTKSYLRYVTGQRFGYVNPRVLLNRIDLVDTARIRLGYRTLFDVGMDTPNRAFYQRALAKVEADSVAVFLHDVQPVDSLYRWFAQMLLSTPPQTPAYSRIMANMERRRWRTHRHPQTCPKYVMVNVPAFMLTAVDGETRVYQDPSARQRYLPYGPQPSMDYPEEHYPQQRGTPHRRQCLFRPQPLHCARAQYRKDRLLATFHIRYAAFVRLFGCAERW